MLMILFRAFERLFIVIAVANLGVLVGMVTRYVFVLRKQ